LIAVPREPWAAQAGGVVIDIRLTPRGGRDAIEGIEQRADGRMVLKVRVRAAPSEGKANAALCTLLAGALGVATRQVEIAGGAASRIKRVRVSGDAATLIAALRHLTVEKQREV
jgi:uncharacterized protein